MRKLCSLIRIFNRDVQRLHHRHRCHLRPETKREPVRRLRIRRHRRLGGRRRHLLSGRKETLCPEWEPKDLRARMPGDLS